MNAMPGLKARQYLDALYPKHGVLFTWIEVATMIRKHEQSVRRYIADGRLRRVDAIRGHNAVTREDLIAFILEKCGRDIDRASYFVQEVEAQYRAHEARLSAVHGSTDDSGQDGHGGYVKIN